MAEDNSTFGKPPLHGWQQNPHSVGTLKHQVFKDRQEEMNKPIGGGGGGNSGCVLVIGAGVATTLLAFTTYLVYI